MIGKNHILPKGLKNKRGNIITKIQAMNLDPSFFSSYEIPSFVGLRLSYFLFSCILFFCYLSTNILSENF